MIIRIDRRSAAWERSSRAADLRTAKLDIEFLLIKSLKTLIMRLSEREAMKVGALIGETAYRLIGSRRRIAECNVRRALPRIRNRHPNLDVDEIVRKTFINLGKNLVEFLRIPLLTSQNISEKIKCEGSEHLQKSLAFGKGALLFIPHMGNWELLAPFFGLTQGRRAVVAFPLKNRNLNRLVEEHRTIFGTEIIAKRGAARPIIRKLRGNYLIGLLADQNAGREGVFLEFFGELASCARGPVSIALKTGAKLHFCADLRQPDDSHLVLISEEFPLNLSGDFERDVYLNTSRLMEHLEDMIIRYPDQWLWIHNRWKTKPDPKWMRVRARRGSNDDGREQTTESIDIERRQTGTFESISGHRRSTERDDPRSERTHRDQTSEQVQG